MPTKKFIERYVDCAVIVASHGGNSKNEGEKFPRMSVNILQSYQSSVQFRRWA
jgi:hypothetical protein